MTAAELALIGISPESVSMAFAFGFMAVYGSWVAGFTVRVALQLVRRI